MTLPQFAAYVCIVGLGVVLTAFFGVWWFRAMHVPSNFAGSLHMLDFAAFALLSYVVWYQISYELFSWYLAAFMRRPQNPPPPQAGLRVALLTAFVPVKEPYDVLEKTLKAMVAVDYPHDTWVLDEGDDERVKKMCARYGANHFSRKGAPHFNMEEGAFKAKTKAGNYNAWFSLHGAKYDIVGQHDVDFVPRRNFFVRTLGYFRDMDVAFVGTPQIYGNKDDSWIARGAAEQAYAFYGPIQKGLYGHDMSLFIGANHIIRTAAHDDIEGYAGHIVEDHLTGMRFYARRWTSVYVPEILAVGEGPSTWDTYFSQQMRWAHGLIDILLKHSPRMFLRMRLKHVANYFMLQQYYFYGLAQVVGIALITLYALFGFQATSMGTGQLLTLYVPLLLIQLCIFFWLQRFNVYPKEESGLLWRARLLNLAAWPVYFLAFIGVLRNKRLVYAVTPKGEQEHALNLALFYPHLILGTITALDMAAGVALHHAAVQILFWAALNTAIMYYFFFAAAFEKISYSSIVSILSSVRMVGRNTKVKAV